MRLVITEARTKGRYDWQLQTNIGSIEARGSNRESPKECAEEATPFFLSAIQRTRAEEANRVQNSTRNGG